MDTEKRNLINKTLLKVNVETNSESTLIVVKKIFSYQKSIVCLTIIKK